MLFFNAEGEFSRDVIWILLAFASFKSQTAHRQRCGSRWHTPPPGTCRAARAETLVRIEALKQVCAQGKMAAVQDWIETFVESGEKLVGFAWHREIVDALAKAWNAPRITGKTAAKRPTLPSQRNYAG